jgi:DDE_Tnp_1-associated/Transposase DDE domain
MAVASETAATETAGPASLPTPVGATLWGVLGTIIDRRGRRGRQYPLQALLAIAIAATLAGANDLKAIFRWGRRLKPEALALFGLEKAPCHSQWFYFFRSLDADALSATLGAFALGGAEPGHLAIDGKTLKGSRRRDTKALHVVSAFSTRVSVVVGDVVLEPDQNEITAALLLLKQLPLEGAIITGDAMFCQREICRTITDGGGDYAFVVKDNQPELKAAIAEAFGELSPLRSPATSPRRAAA